jgi:hypothetical protein
MPKGNKTGPEGHGPRTGRAAGFCAGFAAPGFGRGRGRGFGMGRGMGYRWNSPAPFYSYAPTFSAKDEAEMLSREAQNLEACLDEIKQRLANLEATPEHKT